MVCRCYSVRHYVLAHYTVPCETKVLEGHSDVLIYVFTYLLTYMAYSLVLIRVNVCPSYGGCCILVCDLMYCGSTVPYFSTIKMTAADSSKTLLSTQKHGFTSHATSSFLFAVMRISNDRNALCFSPPFLLSHSWSESPSYLYSCPCRLAYFLRSF
jgi:hypothetical protein